MKSDLTDMALGLYAAIFEDLQIQYPAIKSHLEKDQIRLRRAVEAEGLPFLTITLPDCGRWLESCLSAGHLSDLRPKHHARINKFDRRPAFLRGFYEMIFDKDGTLKVDVDVSAISSLRQVYYLLKKLRLECKDEYVESTIDDFINVERELPSSWPETWDCDDPRWMPRTGHPLWGETNADNRQGDLLSLDSLPPVGQDFDWPGFRRLSARLSVQLGILDPTELRPKHGPGVVSDSTSESTKFEFRIWPRKLQPIFPFDYFALPNFGWDCSFEDREPPSRLIAVPKTQKAPRLIACEPTAYQWIQGGIQRWLEDRIRSTFLRGSIDFRNQGESQRLALEGSRHGRYATVDLSAASDRLCTRLVEYVFQSNLTLLDSLHACRSRAVRLPNGELLLYKKFAPMGSAVTFPIQTVVFSLLAVWAIALTRGIKDDRTIEKLAHEVRVFGDDIILPSDSYPVLCSLLGTLMLKVNSAKSHASGLFRESCGMDAYGGVDVTPAYFLEPYGSSPSSLASVVECSNNFFKKGYWHTADAIQKTVPLQELSKLPVVGPVPTGLAGDEGLLGLVSFCGPYRGHLKSRWSTDFHRVEHQVLSLTSKVRHLTGHGVSLLAQYFFEAPSPDHLYRSGQAERPQPRKRLRWV